MWHGTAFSGIAVATAYGITPRYDTPVRLDGRVSWIWTELLSPALLHHPMWFYWCTSDLMAAKARYARERSPLLSPHPASPTLSAFPRVAYAEELDYCRHLPGITP